MPEAGSSFIFQCKSFPQCFAAKGYLGKTCEGHAFSSVQACGFCEPADDGSDNTTINQCTSTEVSNSQCQSKTCATGCVTQFSAPLGKCVTFTQQGITTSVIVANQYRPCSMVHVRNFWDSTNCTNIQDSGNQWIGSGACTWSEERGGHNYELSFSCAPADPTAGRTLPASRMSAHHRAAVHSAVRRLQKARKGTLARKL